MLTVGAAAYEQHAAADTAAYKQHAAAGAIE
jgi:hypothetical protein